MLITSAHLEMVDRYLRLGPNTPCLIRVNLNTKLEVTSNIKPSGIAPVHSDKMWCSVYTGWYGQSEMHSQGVVQSSHTANILTVLSTAFGSVTCATVIWLHILKPKIAIDLKLYSSMSLNVIFTVVGCNNHCEITVAHVTQPITVNWL